MKNMKEIIKLFIPPLFFKLLVPLRNKFYFFSTINNHKKISDTIFVLGNGPSLKKQLENECSILQSAPCICVNNFVDSEYYTVIKPAVFIYIDPLGYTPEEYMTSLPSWYRETINSAWHNLLVKTEWNMDVIAPSQYKTSYRICKLKENKFLNVLFINMRDCAVSWNKKSMFKLFNRNKLAVPAQTVLHTAVYLAIYWKYKKIVLIGADSSWHEDIEVDQLTNKLYWNITHFYGTEKRKELVDFDSKGKTIDKKLYVHFNIFGTVFEKYLLLDEYADYNAVSVFNASGKSYIDAFTRKTLDDFSVNTKKDWKHWTK